ncbi:MAG: hypothetical protein J6P93_02600 [Alphaproteobacteria bacterium]|nr:hypothetical protein [Alphaproteobacteria bacterium]
MNENHFELVGKIHKPVEDEDVFFVDTKGNKEITSLAIIVDGADGRKKRILPNGEEIALSDIVSGEKTAARVWADLLKDEIAKGALNPEKELSEIVYEATRKATERFSKVAGPVFSENLDPLQIPAASVLVARVNDTTKMFESFSNGDGGMIIRYQDDTVESYIGNEYLKNMRVKRDALIIQEHPDFNEKSPAEQAKIRYQYMQKTKESLGKDYYTPYLGGADNMKNFARVGKISRDKRRNFATHANGMMWTLAAYLPNVKNVTLFSSGIEPAFIDNEIAKEFISEPNQKEAMKTLEMLSALGAVLEKNQHAVAVQSVNNDKVQKVAFTDRTALLFNFVNERD